MIDVTATGRGAGPQSEVRRELKTAGFLAIGWPLFCAAVDWLLAAILVIAVIAGLHVH